MSFRCFLEACLNREHRLFLFCSLPGECSFDEDIDRVGLACKTALGAHDAARCRTVLERCQCLGEDAILLCASYAKDQFSA